MKNISTYNKLHFNIKIQLRSIIKRTREIYPYTCFHQLLKDCEKLEWQNKNNKRFN